MKSMLAASRPMIRTFGVVTDPAHPLMVACARAARTDFRANSLTTLHP
jgi:hypothetical protein